MIFIVLIVIGLWALYQATHSLWAIVAGVVLVIAIINVIGDIGKDKLK